MRSRVVTKVISAAAVALIVELTDLALAKTALSEDRFRVARKILKSGVGAASGALLGKILHAAEEVSTDPAGSQKPAPEVTHA
jgi:purine-nucleoside phosphorylase